MITASRCESVEISTKEAVYSALWMLGITLGLTTIGVALDRIMGEHVMVKALIYSSFFIAFTASCRNTYLKSFSSRARNIIVIIGVPAWYAFFLVVLVLAAAT